MSDPTSNGQFGYQRPAIAETMGRPIRRPMPDLGTTLKQTDRIMYENFPTGGRDIPLSLDAQTLGSSTGKPQMQAPVPPIGS
jgi:hypothetical protein